MKKIIGILGVAVIAATMFFSANNLNSSNSDASLAGLITLNTANAQEAGGTSNCPGGSCSFTTYFAGQIKGTCTACAPEGKTPKCDQWGCTTN